MSLSALWERHGKHDKAYNNLKHVYNWFNEGLERHDLIKAKGVLIQLENS